MRLFSEGTGLEKLAQVDAYQQKTQWSCSAGSLVAVAKHHGIDITEEQAIKAIGAREGRGAETTDIVEGARKLGLEAWEGSFPSLDDAKEVLKAGNPIIADVQSFNYKGKGHYVVITGYKPGKGFILMDPNTKGKTAIPNWRILSDKEMEKKWWDRAMAPPHKLMLRWGVVVIPKEKEKIAIVAPMPGDVLSDPNSLLPDMSELSRGAAMRAGGAGRKGPKDLFDFGLGESLSEKNVMREVDDPFLRPSSGSKSDNAFEKRRGGLGLDSPVKIAQVCASRQMNSFFNELRKTGGDYKTMATIGAIIGGVRGGVRGSEKDESGNTHRASKSMKGAATGATLGVLILAGLERNAAGKSTLPTPQELRASKPSRLGQLPGILMKIVKSVK